MGESFVQQQTCAHARVYICVSVFFCHAFVYSVDARQSCLLRTFRCFSRLGGTQNPSERGSPCSKPDHLSPACYCLSSIVIYVYLFIYMYMYIHTHTHIYICICIYTYRVSQEECARLREGIPYVKLYRYNPKHLYPKLNGYGDNGQRKVGASCGSKYCNLHSWYVT